MTVSVIIPALNAQKFIEKALHSLQKQTYKNLDIILVDNGSTDQTLSIMENYAENHSGVRVITESRKGSAFARNAGLKLAFGEWVQFLDADDMLEPQKIEKQVLLGLEQEANIVAGNFVIKKGIFKLKKKCFTKDAWVALISSQLGVTSSILWRKDTLLKVGGWDNHIESSQEYHLLFKLLKTEGSKIAFDNAYNTLIFEQAESISKSEDEEKRLAIFEENYKLRKEIKLFLSETNKLTNPRESSYNSYIIQLFLWSYFDCKSFYIKCASEAKTPKIIIFIKLLFIYIKRLFVFSVKKLYSEN